MQQYGDITDAFSKAGLSLLGETGTRVVFRSNATPDIVVDISGLMKAKSQTTEDGVMVPAPGTEDVPISSEDTRLLKFIRPEVRLNALGNSISYAPYGRPRRSVAIIFVFTLIASALIGAKIAWVACKKI